ncbi:hypothetical protein GL213_06195 [Halogeometricum borinquense]|uniref:Uncharacterized protein n=2 Tax=Halogeometricum borinquense TaxID=60847 RepID=E4NR93_HALBP|nr:hypothetical protein [Halogeometricum borinquense]ADQ66829.1 hypothetical protein Hbor_12400 [Halogeometricum borinquense DSM 11551]ELY30337.1 hypothetical protein C499_03688 [Halogeometricum borinquense DSM 11551]QIB74856.1 hypothetical protein G3I44_11545 [Halogeometricum borinquense]QIQ76146.1 hypothetical protein GL213_06195 [Halogeometricum borinquense]RYJ14135.1 hypothetical protein ELS19_09275 [Halogeometricum borinquense]
MRVRDWKDILSDVTDAGVDPDGWRAVAGHREDGLGEELFLGHPDAGVYELKTYAKNPMEVRGVGSRVARRIDDDIEPLLPRRGDDGGRFAVQSPPEDEDHAESMAKRLEETVKVHAEAPTTPEDLFTDMMDAIDSPAFGPMEYEFDGRPDRLDDLTDEFSDADELLTEDLDDLIEDDGVGRGFQ